MIVVENLRKNGILLHLVQIEVIVPNSVLLIYSLVFCKWAVHKWVTKKQANDAIYFLMKYPPPLTPSRDKAI